MAKKENNTRKDELQHFELQNSIPVTKPNGDRDYFAEYYRTYKNDYIDQYLRAYRELKDIDAVFDTDESGSKPEGK